MLRVQNTLRAITRKWASTRINQSHRPKLCRLCKTSK